MRFLSIPFVFCSICCLNAQQTTLYDNTALSVVPSFAVAPFVPAEWAAQPFQSQATDHVSAVQINFRRLGNPSGPLSIEIWDHQDAEPGNYVGTVGALELSDLEPSWNLLTFDQLSIPLVPNADYYLLFNSSAASITPDNSYQLRTFRSDAGTSGADVVLGRVDGTWQTLRSLLGAAASYMQMSINATDASLLGDCNADGLLDADDLACVRTIEGRDAVLAVLNTVPGDLNGDGVVAFADFLLLSENFGRDTASYAEGNIDLQGGVEFTDFLILSANFAGSGNAVATVPEPSSALLFTLGLIAILSERKLRSGKSA